ncbi:MAG TPA: hypothetical protein ENN61_01430 [Bacteroidaceae bacterium]|nr:hypothetical protein [Bacteroidaceae bacterium]
MKLLLILMVSVFLIGCAEHSKETQNIVAEIGDDVKFTFDDLQKYVIDWQYHIRYKDRREAYREALDAMVTNQLKRNDFFERGLDQEDHLIQSIRRIINEEMVAEYYKTQYVRKYNNEDEGMSSIERFEKDKKELIDEDKLIWNNKALNELFKWSENPVFFRGEYRDILQKTDNLVILKYDRGVVDYQECIRFFDDVLSPEKLSKINEEEFKKYFLEALRTDIIVKKAEELDLLKNIFNPKTNNVAIRNQIVYLYNVAVIDSQIPVPTDEMLHLFYQQYKDSLYYQLNRIHIYAMIFPEEEKANEIMQEIRNGIPFEETTGRWFVRSFIRDRDGRIRSYLSPEEPFLGERSFQLRLNETTGPVKYYDAKKEAQYAIIKCVNIIPEKQLLFDDVKDTILEDFKGYHREKKRQEVKDRLWKQYDIKIYEDIISKRIN